MKLYIEDKDLEELIETGSNKKYKKFSKDKRMLEGLIMAVNIMRSVSCAKELRKYSFLHYEQLKHLECSSVRIVNGRVERLLFKETDDGLEVTLLELNEDHYGNKK